MPSTQTSPAAGARSPARAASYGQIIEYIPDRLYLASYTHAPTQKTPFPYPATQPQSPSKRSFKHSTGSADSTKSTRPPVYFSVDDYLLYNAFHADFGPLHIGHLYRFAVALHEVLGDPKNAERPVVFWSHADSRSRANAACVLACYMVLLQQWPPHLALAPIAQLDPPLMPFRDAGYSQADYILNVQDVVYGVWKAKEEGLCALKEFNLEEYENFERVDMGDFNWLTPNFVAFASPQFAPIAVIPPTSPQYASLPTSTAAVMESNIPTPFKNVLTHFRARKVGLVVRLNSELYSPSYFTALGIQHIDMIFDDGTCPQLSLVRRFIKMAHNMINVKHRAIAVHCKAGLGRTGCLIGAYLIYRHGFTANEVIAFMRFMRPGMVVGPQQHWLHLNQGTFREWWFEDALKDKLAVLKQTTPTKAPLSTTSPSKIRHHQRLASAPGQTRTPPPHTSQKRAALGEIDDNSHRTASGHYAAAPQDENLPAPTPGQPRKTSKLYGNYGQSASADDLPTTSTTTTEVVATAAHRHADAQCGDSEDEYSVHVVSRPPPSASLARKPSITAASSSPTPKRTQSCYATTTITHSTSQTRTAWTNVRAAVAAASLDMQEALAGDADMTATADGDSTDIDTDIDLDAEYMAAAAPTSPSPKTAAASTRSAMSFSQSPSAKRAAGAINVSKVRTSPARIVSGNGGAAAAAVGAWSGQGIRKTSGRVGSSGAVARVK